ARMLQIKGGMKFPSPLFWILWCLKPSSRHDKITTSIPIDIPEAQPMALLFGYLDFAEFPGSFSRGIRLQLVISQRVIGRVGDNLIKSIPVDIPRPGGFYISRPGYFML